jgi:hypothetical protein
MLERDTIWSDIKANAVRCETDNLTKHRPALLAARCWAMLRDHISDATNDVWIDVAECKKRTISHSIQEARLSLASYLSKDSGTYFDMLVMRTLAIEERTGPPIIRSRSLTREGLELELKYCKRKLAESEAQCAALDALIPSYDEYALIHDENHPRRSKSLKRSIAATKAVRTRRLKELP